MRTYTPSYIFLIALAISLATILTQSCTVEKRKHFPGYSVEWTSKKYQKETETSVNHVSTKKDLAKVAEEADNKDEISVSASVKKEFYQDALTTYKVLARTIAVGFSKDSCDILITQDGDEFHCKVVEIGIDAVKYRKCGFTDGPLISLPRSSVFMIRYSNGEKEIIKPINKTPEKKEDYYENVKFPDDITKRVDVLGVIGFALSIASILPWWFVSALIGFFAGIIAIVFGSISIARILKKSDSRKGLGFAIVSLIVGVALVAATLITWWLIGAF